MSLRSTGSRHYPTCWIVAALIVTTIACCTNVLAASFPFNGSFESVALGEPLGWQKQGGWLVRSEAARDGRNGISLRAETTEGNDILTTEGYLLVTPGESLTLSLQYMSNEGGPTPGLVFCDALGQPVDTVYLEPLPAAAAWTRYERTIALDEQSCDKPYAAVRLTFKTGVKGLVARFDDVKLEHECTLRLRPATPKFKAEERPNLLLNPTLKLGPDGSLPGWVKLEAAGFTSEAACVAPAADGKTGCLALQGATQRVAWLTQPALLDGALPYIVQATVKLDELTAGQTSVLWRLVDPQDEKAVWLQQIAPVIPTEAEDGVATVRIALPRLWTNSGAIQAQVGIVLDPPTESAEQLVLDPAPADPPASPASAGVLKVTAVALQPEPLTVGIRSVAVAGGFKQPKDVSLFVSSVNNTYSVLKPKAYMKIFNANGKVVCEEGRAIVMGARSAAYFPYKPKLVSAGEYKMLVRIMLAGKDLGSAEFQFTVSGS